MKIKILFLIHDLGQGGAEKVLVNLVNNMDKSKFDITVVSLFGGGVNEQFLNKDVHYRVVFPKVIPGNSKWMKIFTPKQLHRICIKEKYDIEISYLEGPTARIISGCSDQTTKLVSWIHVEQHTEVEFASAFRNMAEARRCYNRFHNTVCVSQYVKSNFCSIMDFRKPCEVINNTVETNEILEKSKVLLPFVMNKNVFNLIAVGSLKESKGYDRLLRIVKRLKEERYLVHLYMLGIGPLQQNLEEYIKRNSLCSCVTLLGYQTNPYQYVAKCDLFVCASYAEGFSTAATEALIVGTPVCTVDVSGMKEMLGEDNEYGIVTENNEEALYKGIKLFLDDGVFLEKYRRRASQRGEKFSTINTVKEVEQMLLRL